MTVVLAWTIAKLKNVLAGQIGKLEEELKFYFKEEEMTKDEFMLRQYRLKQGSSIQVKFANRELTTKNHSFFFPENSDRYYFRSDCVDVYL